MRRFDVFLGIQVYADTPDEALKTALDSAKENPKSISYVEIRDVNL